MLCTPSLSGLTMYNIIQPTSFPEVDNLLDELNTDTIAAIKIHIPPYEIIPSNIISLPFDWHQNQIKLLENTEHGDVQQKYKTRSCYVSYMKNTKLLGSVITTDNAENVHKDTYYHHFGKSIGEEKFLSEPEISIDEPVFYLGGTKEYYHWIIDCLSALSLWKALKLDTEIRLFVANISRFQRETLKCYGVPDSAIIEINNKHVNFKHIFIPSTLGGGQAWSPPLYLPELHRESTAHITTDKNTKKYYISRSKTKRRKMNNELGVECFLIEKGFEVLYLEEYSFEEQIKLMKAASIIVSPHGAGLTNIIYCQPQTHIVELLCERYLNRSFYLMSNIGDLLYTPLISTNYEITGEHLHKHTWDVDIQQLEILLEHLEK